MTTLAASPMVDLRGPMPLGAETGRPAPIWRSILLFWALIVALQMLVQVPNILAVRMGDPDDVLRLVQVRDLLAGQGWFDMHQYRVMAPEGVLMHWSRLVDIPLAAVIVLFRPLVGQAGAEVAALLIVPALTVLCTLALAMHTANRLFGRHAALMAGVVVGLSGTMLHQMQPLRIDHHGWQIVAALGAMAGLHARDPRRGGWIIGLSLAASLTISLEGLPLAALFIGALALRAIIERRNADAWQRLGHTALALAVGTAGLFLACRGLADLAQHCDAVSPMHLAALGWTALCCGGLALWRPRSPLVALGVLALAAGGAAAMIAGAAPQCATGAFGGIDPYVKSHWLDHVREGLPVWRSPLQDAVALVGVVPLGLWACWRLLRSAPARAEQLRWAEHGLILLGAAAVGLLVGRAMITAVGLAIVPAAWQVSQWRMRAVAQSGNGRRMAYNLLILLTVLPVIAIAVPKAALAAMGHHPQNRSKGLGSLTGCDFAAGLAPLATMPATDIFAPVDIGPNILLRTRQRVVATGHHRAAAAISDVMHGFTAPPDQALAYMHKRHATLVVVCTVAPEMGLYRAQAPDGLAARLLAGKPPAWLKPVATPPIPAGAEPTNIAIWRVVG
ncbi:hypothetical protein [Novosphingobium sp. SG720]|uniref:hypothetical protein n=1 Tax=Novosphingobium sp. SG720 TaxID=2586998 RepID=UPI0014470E54|nr:hypothetical protein [Novosphingobium sp. SG720]NKJ42615.1 hypothetical protein [Novosphingobium sp. SG720]